MSRIAFYAPLKPPTHPVPSGDREMTRNLMAAIGSRAGRVDLVSELRLFEGAGDPSAQSKLCARAETEVRRLLADPPDADIWVTYHNYYKAPDLIGPSLCRALNLPYVQIESTRAKSRLSGPWRRFAAAAEAASDAADLIFYLTDLDRETLERDRPDHQKLVHLRPFLPRNELPAAADCGAPGRPILSVGMMRPGDKLASYRIMAETLSRLDHADWRLEIAGDGPERATVEGLMAPFGSRVRFLGQLGQAELAAAYRRAALFFWPGVNEAYGIVYLEAQAAGLPVVAQDRPGVRDILAPGDYPSPAAGPSALARTLSALLANPDLRRDRGARARAHVAHRHLLSQAAETFWQAVSRLGERGI